jgi:uncharacterized protein (TIGR00645 family)
MGGLVTHGNGAGMQRAIERLLLGLRWLLLPLYLALLLCLLAICVQVGREAWHLVADILAITDVALVVSLCSLLDLVLLANLLVMVAVSSYESYMRRIVSAGGGQPEWLGKLDSGDVKVKVAVSVCMIAAIHLLRAFLEDEPVATLAVLAGVQLVFVLFALALALVDRATKHDDPAHD